MKVLLTGGLGDVIALECFLTEYERSNIDTIYYVTRAKDLLVPCFQSFPNYLKLKNHIAIWDNFVGDSCFIFKTDVINKDPKRLNPLLLDVQDYGINVMKTMISTYRADGFGREYVGSSFIKNELVSINRFSLPKKYISIHPYTANDGIHTKRYITSVEWDGIIKYLNENNMFGVIINNTDFYNEKKFADSMAVTGLKPDAIPTHGRLMNLTNQTSILEAIEIVKGGNGFFGINSCFSILSSYIFKFPDLRIKCSGEEDGVYRDKEIHYLYYPMQEDDKDKKIFNIIFILRRKKWKEKK